MQRWIDEANDDRVTVHHPEERDKVLPLEGKQRGDGFPTLGNGFGEGLLELDLSVMLGTGLGEFDLEGPLGYGDGLSEDLAYEVSKE